MRCIFSSHVILGIALACTAAGCSRPPQGPAQSQEAPPRTVLDDHDDHDDHDHDNGHDDHEHPETLAAGVAQLKQAVADVRNHLAADKADKADDVVHGVGHLIEDIRGLLPKENLSVAGQAAAAAALDEIFACFDELDTALHAAEGTGDSPADVQSKVAKRIEAAIKVLESPR